MTSAFTRRFGLLRSVKKTIAAFVLAFTVIASTPHSVLASNSEEVEHYDGRIQGYDPDVELKSSGTGMAWMLVLIMGIACVSVIFKDAKRSHLD